MKLKVFQTDAYLWSHGHLTIVSVACNGWVLIDQCGWGPNEAHLMKIKVWLPFGLMQVPPISKAASPVANIASLKRFSAPFC